MATSVEQLRPVTRGHDLTLKIVDAKVVVDRSQAGYKNSVRVAECIAGDATGTIVLVARNEQVDVCQPGAFVHITNGKVEMYRGSMRLSVDKAGQLEAAEGHSFKPQVDNNLSLIEFELIPFDLAGPPPA